MVGRTRKCGDGREAALPIEFLERTAKVLKLLAHPYRLKIIEILEGEEEGVPVHEIILSLGIAQAAVSQHLNSMARVGLVESSRRGKEVWYRISDPSTLTILNCIRCRRQES